MLKGYTVQPELFDILCVFRLFKFALIGETEELLYYHIKINPDQAFP